MHIAIAFRWPHLWLISVPSLLTTCNKSTVVTIYVSCKHVLSGWTESVPGRCCQIQPNCTRFGISTASLFGALCNYDITVIFIVCRLSFSATNILFLFHQQVVSIEISSCFTNRFRVCDITRVKNKNNWWNIETSCVILSWLLSLPMISLQR